MGKSPSTRGKCNALTRDTREAVCDIDVQGANLIAQRVRPVSPKFHENLADLIKGLLTAQTIFPSLLHEHRQSW